MRSRAANAKFCKLCAPKAAKEQARAKAREDYENMTDAQKEKYLAEKKSKRSSKKAKARIKKYNRFYYKHVTLKNKSE